MSDEYKQGYRWSVEVWRQFVDSDSLIVLYFVDKPVTEEIEKELDALHDLSIVNQWIGAPEPVLDPDYHTPLELAKATMSELVKYYNSFKPHVPVKRNTFKDKHTIIEKILDLRPSVYDSAQSAVKHLLSLQNDRGQGLPYRFILLCVQSEFPSCGVLLQDIQALSKHMRLEIEREF